MFRKGLRFEERNEISKNKNKNKTKNNNKTIEPSLNK